MRGPVADGPRSLRNNMLYAVGGMGVYSASQLGVTILLAKFTSSAVLGAYFYAMAVSTPVILLLALELRAVFVSDTRNEFSYGVYRATRSLMLLLAAAILGLFLLGMAWNHADPATLALLGMVFIAKLQWAGAELRWGVFNRRERLDQLAGATFLRGATMLASYGVVLPFFSAAEDSRSDAWAAASAAGLNVIAWWLVDRLYDVRRIRALPDLECSWTWPAMRRLVRRAFPLGLVAMTINLNDNLPRLVLTHFGSPAALGYFGALFAITLAGQLIVVQSTNAATNRIALAFHSDRREFWKLVRHTLAIALSVGMALLLVIFAFGEPLLRVLYQPDYARYVPELRIVVIAQGLALITSVLGLICTQMGVFWTQVPAQAITLASTAVAALLLIPQDPIRGAAWTAMVRAVVQLAAYATCFLAGVRSQTNRDSQGRP